MSQNLSELPRYWVGDYGYKEALPDGPWVLYEDAAAALAAEKERWKWFAERGMSETTVVDLIQQVATAEARCDTLAGALRTAKAACEIIAGKRQCLDNLMGNGDVAEAALAAIDAALSTILTKPNTE